MGGDRDRRLATGQAPDDVAQPRVPGHRLEAAARELVAQPHGEAAQDRRAGGPRPELDLAPQLGERPRAVEAARRWLRRDRRGRPRAGRILAVARERDDGHERAHGEGRHEPGDQRQPAPHGLVG